MKDIYGIGIILSRRCKSDDSSISFMAYKMKRKYDKYWENVNNINTMLFIAVILDPQCKLEYVDWVISESYDVDIAKVLKDKVKQVLTSMYEFYSSTQSSPNIHSNNQSQDPNDMEVENVEDVADFMNSLFNKQKVGQ
uniref:hAT-like transposase RNase-H fold domain-containing protein n=1 Tax=Nelumbo nucifera TaxID=4432 RepID=A0A822Z1X7_NELNU|nr:TPA_asm: hypothetical protein HUJ06_008086 [Nelumbo nucifera]